jgi:perosamine synthetase
MIPVMRPWLGEEEVEAAAATIRSGWVAQGPRVAEFEERFADYVGTASGVAVSSCTAGLHLVLHALGIGRGDEVIVPSLSFIATANVPRYVGAQPIFADVDPITQNVTAETIAAVITERTAAVIAVHQVGMPLDLAAIRRLCTERGIKLIEDAACAAGSVYRDKMVGAGPDAVVFSFHPRKLLTTGEGGMVVTSDESFAARLRTLRQHAMSLSAFDRHDKAASVFEEYPELGFNFRMTDIQAAIGIVQLGKFDEMIRQRRELAALYGEGLANVPGTRTPVDPPYGRTNFQSYSVVLSEEYPVGRDDLIARLHEAGISSRRGVMAAHTEPTFRDHPRVDLPETELLADTAIILPLYYDMTEADLSRVVDAMASATDGE